MRNTPIFLLLLFTVVMTYGQSEIAYLIEKKSNAVLFEDDSKMTVYDFKNYDFERHYKLLIKNKNAEGLKKVVLCYSKFRKIKKASVTIRDLKGNEISKNKLNDFKDEISDLSSLASDSRCKVLSPSISKYPIVMEVEYSHSNSASLFYSSWQPQKTKMRVVKSQFEVIDLTKTNVNYFSSNVAQPEISEDSKAKRYLWKIENVAPFEYEPFNYNLEDYSPTVELSPIQFEMDGFEGDLSNWESFGNWINTLNASKGVFSDEEIRYIKNLGLEKDNTLETIKSVYAYLQNTTRYVSIQIGIGGYQPFASSFVHEKKYGDCKALSNYTHSLLKLFNIESYYTLINAGDYKADLLTKHPKPRFNHAILSVPIKNDTIFLECTSQTNPFGYSGLFTGNRKALLIKKDASRIINSKHYKPSDNQQNTNILVALDPNGVNAAVTIEKRFTGTEIEDNNFLYQYFKSKTDFKDWVSDNYNWGNIKIDTLKRIDLKEDSVPEGGYHIRFRSPLEVVMRGNRIFISPKKYLSGSIRPRKLKERKTPIRIRFGRHYTDSIEYQVPKAYKIENAQKQIEIKSEFGYYLRAVIKKENKIFVRRLFYLNDGRYNPEDYNALYSFLIAVNKNDAKKIILVKNDS